jgi:sec-independent protein translocase protein TatC
LAIAVFAAFITPSADPYTMLALMLPMMLFYEAAIIVARLLGK